MSNYWFECLKLYSLTWLVGERQTRPAAAAPLYGHYGDERRLATVEVCQGAAGSIGGAGVHVFVDSCGHIVICLQGSSPGHKAHITGTLYGHTDTGWRTGAWEKVEKRLS